MGSLICRSGILGGGIYIDDTSITYKTNKLTVDRKYKNLVLPLAEISALTWKWILFPIATIQLASGEQFRFIIFNKARFNKCYAAVKNEVSRTSDQRGDQGC